MNRFNILLLFVIWGCFGCSSPNPNIEITDPDFEVPVIAPTGDEAYLNLDSDYIFDQEKLPTFELRLPGSALAQINSDPAKEEYVEGQLIFEGDTLSPVGIRYKGSIGAFVNCVSGDDWSDPAGYKTCTKLSMKVKINWDGSDLRFYGLKKLQFHSMNLDPSQMRERLGYWLFREMGVPAPRSVHARLLINGRFSGLYALTEQIDGRFTRYNYEDGKGNLYKEIWPLNDRGQAYSEKVYLDHLKTNEDENPSADLIRNFALEIAQADESELKTVIEKWMKVEEIISYAVVDRAIRNDDGAFHWYCGGNSCSPHNFYWYENPSESSLHLIPWDLDNAFENIITNENPVTPIADDWGETSHNCNSFAYGAFRFQQRSAACDKLTLGWTMYETEYEQLLAAFKNGPFAASSVEPLMDSWAAQIRAATLEAEEAYGDAISLETWEWALEDLRGKLEYARQN